MIILLAVIRDMIFEDRKPITSSNPSLHQQDDKRRTRRMFDKEYEQGYLQRLHNNGFGIFSS
jgi:hypothetical protein